MAGAPDCSADVVLYLGVHHHLLKQVGVDTALATALAIARSAKRYVAVRSPERFLFPLSEAFAAAGFPRLYRDDDNPNVGALAVFAAS